MPLSYSPTGKTNLGAAGLVVLKIACKINQNIAYEQQIHTKSGIFVLKL